MPISELDSKLNELAFTLGMSRQHKKLIKELLVELTQEWYLDGYDEGFNEAMEENHSMVSGWSEIKEKSE